MNTILIILSFIGLLKLVSLFILAILSIKWHKNNKNYGLHKLSNMYKDDSWYIIPTITIDKGDRYFEVITYWLCFVYYTDYYIKDYDKKEKD